MKKIVTIDFDIIMHPSIELYNDSDMSIDEYLLEYSFLGILEADLELYSNLTKYISSFNKDNIHFLYSHDEIISFLENQEEQFILVNIDHHHDLGYGKYAQWSIPLRIYNEGNWVKKLYDLNKIKKYIWLKDYRSNDVASRGEKFITEKHFISNYNLDDLKDADELYISLSPEWVPEYYRHLYDLWQDLINNK